MLVTCKIAISAKHDLGPGACDLMKKVTFRCSTSVNRPERKDGKYMQQMFLFLLHCITLNSAFSPKF